MRRSFIAGIHGDGSRPGIWAASVDRQPDTSKPVTRPMPVRPSSSASRNAECDVPKTDTIPIPATVTGRRTRGTLPLPRMTLQRGARAISAASMLGDRGAVQRYRGHAAIENRPELGPPESFDELFQRGQRANAAIKTLTARFTETTTSSLLTRPLVARGTLAVVRPSRVVLRYTEPDARVVLIDGNRMTMSWPSRNIRQVTDIGATQGRIQKYFVNGSAEDLRHEFEIDEHGTSDRRGPYHVSLVPKRKQIRETLARLDLWVNPSSLLLEALHMTFANGDTKEMTFEDVVPNASIDPTVFTVDR